MAEGEADASLPMSPPRLIGVIRATLPEDGIACLDNGLYKVPCSLSLLPPPAHKSQPASCLHASGQIRCESRR